MEKNRFYLPQSFVSSEVRVALIGLGGTGGEMADNLARLHLILKELDAESGLKITFFDDDVVSKSNIGRTRFSPSDVGQQKAELMAYRYNMFYGLDIEYQNKRFDINSTLDYDLIVSATDSAKFRVDMGEFIAKKRVNADFYTKDRLWLDMGNETYSAQVVLSHITKGNRNNPTLPTVYDLYKEELIEAVESEKLEKTSCGLLDSLSAQSPFINKAISTQAGVMLDKLFRKGVLLNHGAFINIDKTEAKPLAINPNIWEFMIGSPFDF